MMKIMTVAGLIEHLSKYPGDLKVSCYMPHSVQGYRVVSPRSAQKQWLYNTKTLYMPMIRTRALELPKTYKPVKKKLRRSEM